MQIDDLTWASYNADRANHDLRPLCARVLELAGPGNGRRALDLGAGAGVETEAMLRAGWAVTAIDADATTADRIRAKADGLPTASLDVRTVDYADITALPTADLIYSGYSLPYAPVAVFPGLWGCIREALQPGGWFGAHLFGDRDSQRLEGNDETFLTRTEALALLKGLEIVQFDEEDEDGEAYTGPKHWHVFHVIAKRPA